MWRVHIQRPTESSVTTKVNAVGRSRLFQCRLVRAASSRALPDPTLGMSTYRSGYVLIATVVPRAEVSTHIPTPLLRNR